MSRCFVKKKIDPRVVTVAKLAFVSVSALGLGVASAQEVRAQPSQATQEPATTESPIELQLPPVQVNAPRRLPRRGRVTPRGQNSQLPTPPGPQSQTPPADSQDARTGTVGVYSNSTSVATKTNTPLVNIPQSLNVLTKGFIRDQGFQGLTDVTRYVPGVAVHQGEGNRDELVIRGVDASANF